MRAILVVVLLITPQVFAGANSQPQAKPNTANKYCEFSSDEIDVYRRQLIRDSSPKRTLVVMATTLRWIDSFNLHLADQGHAIPRVCVSV